MGTDALRKMILAFKAPCDESGKYGCALTFGEWSAADDAFHTLETENVAEKKRRIYYQDIVYDACNQLDQFQRSGGRSKSERIACGTVNAPCKEVQEALRAALTTMASR